MTQYSSTELRSSIHKAMIHYPYWPFSLILFGQKFRSVWIVLQKEVRP